MMKRQHPIREEREMSKTGLDEDPSPNNIVDECFAVYMSPIIHIAAEIGRHFIESVDFFTVCESMLTA